MNLPHSLSDQPSKSLSPGNSTVRMNDVPTTTHTASSVCLDAAGPARWRWRDNKRIKKGEYKTSRSSYVHIRAFVKHCSCNLSLSNTALGAFEFSPLLLMLERMHRATGQN